MNMRIVALGIACRRTDNAGNGEIGPRTNAKGIAELSQLAPLPCQLWRTENAGTAGALDRLLKINLVGYTSLTDRNKASCNQSVLLCYHYNELNGPGRTGRHFPWWIEPSASREPERVEEYSVRKWLALVRAWGAEKPFCAKGLRPPEVVGLRKKRGLTENARE